jgi:hypothetical protein
MKRRLRAILEYLKIIETGSINPPSSKIQDTDKITIFEKLVDKSNTMKTAQQVYPRKEYIEASKNRIFDQLMDSQKALSAKSVTQRRKSGFVRTFVATPAFSVILILILGFGFVGSVQAADSALPGNALYFVDIAIEEARMLLALDDIARVQLRLGFAAERLHEAQQKFANGDTENAILALTGFEQQMRAISILILNAKDEIKPELVRLVAASYSSNSEVLAALSGSSPPEAAAALLHALGVSEHTIIDISILPEVAAMDIIVNTTLKFLADAPKVIKGFTPSQMENSDTNDPESDGYLPPGIIDNPSHEDGDLPPGLEDKKKPPGLEDKDRDKDKKKK